MLLTILLLPSKNACEQSITDFWSYIFDTQRAVQDHLPITKQSVTSIITNTGDDVASTF